MPGGARARWLLDELSAETKQRQRSLRPGTQLCGMLLEVTDPVKLCSQAHTEEPRRRKSTAGPHLWEGSCKPGGSEQAH